MTLRCRIFGHNWRLIGGLARNAHPTIPHPATSEYHCEHCGTVAHVERDCAAAPRSPSTLADI